jgi:hypothetical protein
MRIAAAVPTMLLAACAAVAEPSDEEWPYGEEASHVRISFEAGQRSYSDDAWEGLEDPTVLAITGSHEPPGSFAGLDAGLVWSSERGTVAGQRLESNGWELYGGVMRSFWLWPERLVVDVGAGLAGTLLYERNRDESGWEDSIWASAYGRASLSLRVGEEAFIGVAVRSVRGGSTSSWDVDRDGDYDQITFGLTARW